MKSFFLNLTEQLILPRRIIRFFAGCHKNHALHLKGNYKFPVINMMRKK